MCRLLGSVARTPVTLDHVLGQERDAFLQLARRHGDGWGHAWSADGELAVRKAPESALESAELAEVAARQPADAALTHLRWATLGLPIAPENTHPFTDGRVAFAHNGSIAPPAALDALVAPELAGRRQGDTDSERYFLALLSRLAGATDVASAVQETVADVLASAAKVKSLNAMLLTDDGLYAICCYDPLSDDDPQYYPLLYRRRGDTVVVVSTGWTDGSGWHSLSNGQLLVVDRQSLETTVLPIPTPRGVGDRAGAGGAGGAAT